ESGPSVAWKQPRRNADREAFVHATPPEHSKGIQGGDRSTQAEGVPRQASAPLALRPALHPPRRLEVGLDSPRLQSAGIQNPRSLRGRVPSPRLSGEPEDRRSRLASGFAQERILNRPGSR